MLSVVDIADSKLCIGRASEDFVELQPHIILYPSEVEQWKDMSPHRAWDFLRGRYVLKSLLIANGNIQGSLIGTAVSIADDGKPFVLSVPDLFCSISHTEEVVIAAIGTQMLGVDVEKIKSRHPALLSSIADADEIRALGNIYPHDMLPTVAWVIKEATAKADTTFFSFDEYKIHTKERVFVTRGENQWDIHVQEIRDHIMALAVRDSR